MRPTTDGHALWDLVEPLLGSGDVEAGTIMGGACLRANGEFVAMPMDPDSRMGAGGPVVLKLDRNRVAELVESGEGLPFGPGAKIFREWVQITHHDHERWLALLGEAIAFSRAD